MRYRALDSNGDMTFGNGQLNFLRDTPETVAQAVLTRLRLWVNEWFLDSSEGTPYQNSALGTGKLKSIKPAIRYRILQTQNVTSIESLELDYNSQTRNVQIRVTINTAFGQTTLQGVL
jgi:hypothetical protein